MGVSYKENKLMDIEKAISFVKLNGNLIEKARLSAVLHGQSPSTEVLSEIEKYQKRDGGFSYWCPQVSNLCDTAYILLWLDDLESHRCEIADRACRFLLDRQLEDGG